MNRPLLILVLTTIALVACSPQKEAMLPTVAMLPSPTVPNTATFTPIPTSTPTITPTLRPTSFLRPTFTLVPITPTAVNWARIESDIVIKVMPILKDGVTSNYVGIAGSENYLKITYRYDGGSVRNEDYLEKIPYLLCDLREAGLTNLTLEARIGFYSRSGKSLGGDYLCISPDSINQMNCTDPSRTNLSRIRNNGTCNE